MYIAVRARHSAQPAGLNHRADGLSKTGAAPAMNRMRLPSMGTCASPCTTTAKEMPDATSITAPMKQTSRSKISVGVTGMTSRCATVPCARLRMGAAPVGMMESMVTLLMICITAPNHDLWSVGLKRAPLDPRVRWLPHASAERMHSPRPLPLAEPGSGPQTPGPSFVAAYSAGGTPRQHAGRQRGLVFVRDGKKP